jgi:hypothetical protein
VDNSVEHRHVAPGSAGSKVLQAEASQLPCFLQFSFGPLFASGQHLYAPPVLLNTLSELVPMELQVDSAMGASEIYSLL